MGPYSHAFRSSGGEDFQILNVGMTGSDIQVIFGNPVKSITIQSRDGQDLYIRKQSGATEYFTVHAGAPFSMDIIGLEVDSKHSMWLRGTNGDVAEIVGLQP